MAKQKKHVAWDFYKDYHKGGDCGCIWRHASGFGETPCHYAVNGYDESGSRTGLYNKNHRAAAVAAGHAVMQNGQFVPKGDLVAAQAKQEAKERDKGRGFIRKFEGRFFGAMYYLKLHENGWHYGHQVSKEHVPKNFKAHGDQKTFAIYQKPGAGGYGAWYPYHHNYHHLVPQGALHECVIGNDDKSEKRVAIICASKWNINKKANIILLPEEEFISLIVELPAHTPWDERSHPEYSASMVKVLKATKDNLSANIGENECEAAEAQVAQDLDNAVKRAYDQVPKMAPGKKLGAVT